MPSTMNISLPQPLKKFVDQQVKQRGYSGVSDYIRDLIRTDQQGAAALRRLIAEGVASGAAAPVDKAYWAVKHSEGRRVVLEPLEQRLDRAADALGKVTDDFMSDGRRQPAMQKRP